MKSIMSFCFFFVISLSSYGNIGHRLGVDHNFCESLPENSLEVFECAINNNIEDSDKFDYYELDIQESYSETSKSCEYFVFHNQTNEHKFIDLVPFEINDDHYTYILERIRDRSGNSITLDELKIEHMLPSEIRLLFAQQKRVKYRIPTLDEVLTFAINKELNDSENGDLPTKIMIEIKRMRTKGCVGNLINKLVKYQEKGLNLGILIRLKGGKLGSRSYKLTGRPKPSKTKVVGGLRNWCGLISDTKLFISTTRPHYDMCHDKKGIADIQSYRYDKN